MKKALFLFSVMVVLVGSGNTPGAQVGKAEFKARLTEIQYRVTQENGTERPFQNAFWDNKRPGIYVDVVSGEPLFSSVDKFRSGTGWPSFVRPLVAGNVIEVLDNSLGGTRVELRSRKADSHLGHVFEDGPKPTGLRYCINSAALRFIEAERLAEEGYGAYAAVFPRNPSSPSPGTGGAVAVLAAGCFWCTEAIFEAQPGVTDVVSGYAGGRTANPTYQEVGTGRTGHTESIRISYDPGEMDFKTLLELFWETFDPTNGRGVEPDFGDQYRPVVFYSTEAEKVIAEASKAAEQRNHKKLVDTEILPLLEFYPAEEYHQDFVKRNPDHSYVQRVSYPRMARVGVYPR